jgi:hypothetical protein
VVADRWPGAAPGDWSFDRLDRWILWQLAEGDHR